MEYKLSDICFGITDGSHNPPSGGDKSPYLMLSSKNIFDDKITYDEPRYLSEELFYAEHKRTNITSGDVLMTIVGTVGRTAVVSEQTPAITLQRSVAVLHPRMEICVSRYLMYLLRSRRAYFEAEAHGVAQKGIYLKQLSDVRVNVPDIEKQQSVVCILDKVQDIILKRQNEISQMDDLIKARFVELFGDPITNDKGWDVVELNSVCDGVGDGLHGTPEYDDSGEYPFINGNNLMNGVIEITPATKMVNEDTYKKHFIELTKNAILLSINGTLGKLAFYNGENVMLGKSACYCNLKSEINREFVYGVMTTDAFARFLESNATASTIKNVGLKAIRGFKLILPPENLQNQFVEFSKQVDKSKVVVQKALDEAKLLFDSLMQQCFG